MHMKNVYGILAQFRAEREWNSDKWGVWKSGPDSKIGPPVTEPIYSLGFGYIQRVVVDGIYLGQCFYQIGCIALVTR